MTEVLRPELVVEVEILEWTKSRMVQTILKDEARRDQLTTAIEQAGGDPKANWELELREVVMVRKPEPTKAKGR